MNPYKGMRWLKCDLHMHTPADANHWLGERLLPGEEEKTADTFAQACQQAGLDVVAVVDHNFLSKDFFPYLQKALDRVNIALFPGFEMEADVGKGIHVLCLFEPKTDLSRIDHLLTECGVGYPREANGTLVKSTKRLKEILEIIQKPDEKGSLIGLVIVPHIFQDSLFDGKRLADWLQREEFLNPDLLAVEVPKPVASMHSAWKHLFNCDHECTPDWRRIRPITTLMSSDNKKLLETGPDGKPVPNSIGYRHTWIKMSHPSIESLRQAFLDHTSRIRTGGDNPALQEKHARILSMSVSQAAFLNDQEIHFSSNLNCIIGGRGSGKSALLEGMRLAMGKDRDGKLDNQSSQKVERIRHLLKKEPTTQIKVHWRDSDGVEDVLLFANNTCQVEGRKVTDMQTFLHNLGIQFFTQQQLSQLTMQGRQALLPLLDDFIREKLNQLATEERELRGEIEQLFRDKSSLTQTQIELKRLQEESNTLERQWTARTALQGEAQRYQGLKAEGEFIKSIKGSMDDHQHSLLEMVNDIYDSHSPLGSVAESWPHGPWFAELDEKLYQAKTKLRDQVTESIKAYLEEINKIFREDDRWLQIKESLAKAKESFTQACAAQGVSLEDVSRIHDISTQRVQKKAELDKKLQEIHRLQQGLHRLPHLFQRLHTLWQEIHAVRQHVAGEITRLTQVENKPVIAIEVSYGSDESSFLATWQKLSPSGRSRLGKNWPEIGKIVRHYFLQSGQPGPSPWEMVQGWMEDDSTLPGTFRSPLNQMQLSFDDIKNYLLDSMNTAWQEVRVTRVEDTVDLLLYRKGSDKNSHEEVGKISDGSLSEGQRNTAALALLLARGDHPIIIDQPEDEMDSNFIYTELVPMLRQLKQTRQIILVTHNANLPVNGDAELVYALQVTGGRGMMLAVGGLDQKAVSNAVLDIMEGSERAFLQRKEKYHF